VLISRIERAIADLRPSEARVASFVLSRPHVVAELSIKDLSEAVGVSEPTVMRFCKAVGCVGYQELKRFLTRDLERRSTLTHRNVDQLADADRLASRLLEAVARDVAGLGQQLGQTGLEALARLSEFCAAQRRVTVIAADPGMPRAAADLADSLAALGLTVEMGTPGVLARHALLLVVAGPAGAGAGEVLARAAVADGASAGLVVAGPLASEAGERLAIVAMPSQGEGLGDRLGVLVLLRALVAGVGARLERGGGLTGPEGARALQASRERAQDQSRRAWRLAAEAAATAAAEANATDPLRDGPPGLPDQTPTRH
jgi:RpiR family carbohydrate utilization transcriptional regulator